MHDNKVRLSPDVLEKAEQIAAEWGLKNARAAVEAVFRRYSDEYLLGRGSIEERLPELSAISYIASRPNTLERANARISCEALDELDDLLAM